jgi:flagellar FliL protein
LETAINARMPLMDDIVITILSAKTYDELYTAEGKEALRTEIMNTMNERLPEFHIISVYFTEFVVQ